MKTLTNFDPDLLRELEREPLINVNKTLRLVDIGVICLLVLITWACIIGACFAAWEFVGW